RHCLDHRGAANRIRLSSYAAHGLDTDSDIQRTRPRASHFHHFHHFYLHLSLPVENRGNTGHAPSAILIKTEKEIGQIVFW
ncbi:MAG TPA: hypothetical protein VEK37_08190, partial [Gemmatimonadaceae bacterium]|nr:hypothetical protein [Gemmatimonadaceae bacterium]